MWAMIVKEFRQLRRDRRTLAMMIVMPVVLLIVFGYAASVRRSRRSCRNSFTIIAHMARSSGLPISTCVEFYGR